MIEELYWSSVLDLPFFAMLGLSEVTLSKAIFERLLSERKQTTKFLGKMSHELRTPLVGLRAGWELIQEFLPPGRDATAINHIRLMVEKCFMGILTQIDNILDESKFQSGNLLLHVAQENLHDLLKTAVNMVELKAAAKNVTVALDIHPTVPHRVIVDWQKLTKVILNLLTNAIKYSHDGQRVEVSVRAPPIHHCRVTWFVKFAVLGKLITCFSALLLIGGLCRSPKQLCECCHLVISVKDYGVGLAQDQIGKIFRAYELGVNRGTSLPYGAGFGLSISRHIVEMMGGWIDVHSAGEEKGAEFLVHLHIKEVPPEAPFVKCPVSPQKFVEPLKIRDPDGVDLHRPILLAEVCPE
jgi:signal transduction histidine kinase